MTCSSQSSTFNHPDFIRLTVQTIEFFIVEPSPLSSLLGNEKRYQIDYILVKQHFRNSIRDMRIFPGADIDTDHNQFTAEVQTRLKEI